MPLIWERAEFGSIGRVRSAPEPWLTFPLALPPLAYLFLSAALAALPPATVATTATVVVVELQRRLTGLAGLL